MCTEEDQLEQAVGYQLQGLRRRLLDLSNRSPLLNSKFSARSRTHIRVVDELPEFLFETLLDGKPMTFRALPQPDERARARAEEEGGERLEVLVARQEGLDPGYELPEPTDGTQAKHHTDRFIQTLCFPEQMERKLSGIRNAWALAKEEMGAATLFAAFGYLEWYESKSSDRPHLAPLLLHELDLTRTQRDGKYSYDVVSTGEDTQSNLTLTERLRRDFGVVLPEVREDTTPESYFREVAAVVAANSRWRIRRYVTVGIFTFARLVMYRDLDPAEWPRTSAQHPVVSRLLAGSGEVPDGDLPVYDVDSSDVGEHVPYLIADADSSQHSAIVDVIGGKNLVVVGPPGTGKSQTITNLIAACLAKNKSVLFVAEKMAALNVVKSRLDDASLGQFCLELHSTKARKKDVLAHLGARLDMQGQLAPPANLEKLRGERSQLEAQLRGYAECLNEPFAAVGLTMHELLWREQVARERVQDAPDWLAALQDCGREGGLA